MSLAGDEVAVFSRWHKNTYQQVTQITSKFTAMLALPTLRRLFVKTIPKALEFTSNKKPTKLGLWIPF
jgi:hypothetical protein